jgi:hypothetical protein
MIIGLVVTAQAQTVPKSLEEGGTDALTNGLWMIFLRALYWALYRWWHGIPLPGNPPEDRGLRLANSWPRTRIAKGGSFTKLVCIQFRETNPRVRDTPQEAFTPRALSPAPLPPIVSPLTTGGTAEERRQVLARLAAFAAKLDMRLELPHHPVPPALVAAFLIQESERGDAKHPSTSPVTRSSLPPRVNWYLPRSLA